MTQETADKLNRLIGEILNDTPSVTDIINDSLDAENHGKELIETLQLDEKRRRVCKSVMERLVSSRELLKNGKIAEMSAILDKCIENIENLQRK